MLLSGTMALHVGAVCVWCAAGALEALSPDAGQARRARRWALGAMSLALAAGAAVAAASWPVYRGEGWLRVKGVFALAAAVLQILRASGRLSSRAVLRGAGAALAAALVLSFTRPF